MVFKVLPAANRIMYLVHSQCSVYQICFVSLSSDAQCVCACVCSVTPHPSSCIQRGSGSECWLSRSRSKLKTLIYTESPSFTPILTIQSNRESVSTMNTLHTHKLSLTFSLSISHSHFLSLTLSHTHTRLRAHTQ